MSNSNKMFHTIVALATPIAESAIGVVRLSGQNAFQIIDRLCANRDFSSPRSHFAVLAKLQDSKGEILDEALVTCFRGPRSFTGEDVVEISCHGNPLILRDVIQACFDLGARAAEPGEFTRRAYLNGKLDLTQAEAVNDLIHAHTRLSRLSAVNQIAGRLSETLEPIHSKILDLLSLLEVAIDHGDLDLDFRSYDEMEPMILELLADLKKLLQTSQSGKILHYGLKIALVGSPNTGKSSLMNFLLKEDRVIVSELAGTTRDLIEDELNIRGIPVKLRDTAGLRDSEDSIEKLGMLRSEKAVEESDLLFFLIDSSREITENDRFFYEKIRKKPHFVVLNKQDLPCVADLSKMNFEDAISVFSLSALTGEGVSQIEEAVESFYWSFGKDPHTEVMLTNVRQENLVREAYRFLERALNALKKGFSEEFLAADIRKARNALESIVGKSDDDVILDRIFSSFCVGK